MSKQWTLSGKSISDFTSKIDYRLNSLDSRLELVRDVLGEKQLIHCGTPLKETSEIKYIVEDYSNLVCYYHNKAIERSICAYDDFFPEYFSSTPKFSLMRVNNFLESLTSKKIAIEQYKNDKKEYEKLISEGFDVAEPIKPKSLRITPKELRQEQSIIRLKELMVKEDLATLTCAEIVELRSLKTHWLYNGDRETSKVIKTDYDYSDITSDIKNLEDVEVREEDEEKVLSELRELDWLLRSNDLREKQYKRLEELSRTYAKKKPVHVNTNYASDNTIFLNYTPLIGTTNEVNMKQVVSNLKPLSEHDNVCKALESMGSYLIRQHELEEKKNAKKNSGEYENLSPTLDERDKRKNEQREIVSGVDHSDIGGEAPTSKKNQVKLTKYEVKKSDRDFIINAEFPRGEHESKFPYFLMIDRSVSREETENEMGKSLVQYGEQLDKLRIMLETGQYIGQLKQIDHKTRYKIQRWIGDLKISDSELLRSQHRFIEFKKLEKGFAKVTFDDNTGYYNANDEYVEVSKNKFEFGKKEHISGLIRIYPDIVGYEKRVETDLYHIMLMLIKLIRLGAYCGVLKHHELDILKWHMYQNLPFAEGKNEPIKDKHGEAKCKTIQKLLKEVHRLEWDHPQISRTLKHSIPEKLRDIFVSHQEVWAYTFKLRGDYKKCSGCHKNKLAMKKYFTIDKKSKDGFGVCRTCKSKK